MNLLSEVPVAPALRTWYRQIDSWPDFPSRLVGHTGEPTRGAGRIGESQPVAAGGTGLSTSLIVHPPSDGDEMSTLSTTATEAIPALTQGSSSASSAPSADTDIASALDGGYTLESEAGVLTIPNRFRPDSDLLCPFQILDCREIFSDVVEFKTHVFSHFKGHSSPKTASCFLCDGKFSQNADDHVAWAWDNMLSHLVQDHFRQGQRLATVRTDFGLMRWMYSRRIISDAEFRRTQMIPRPTLLPAAYGSRSEEIVEMPLAPMAPLAVQAGSSRSHASVLVGLQNEAFTVHAGGRSERRRREGTRPFATVRGHL